MPVIIIVLFFLFYHFFLLSFNKNQKRILICRNKNVKFPQTMILSVVLRVYFSEKNFIFKVRFRFGGYYVRIKQVRKNR